MNSSFVTMITITVSLLFLGLVFRKNKLVFILQSLWMFIFIGLNTGGADFQNNYETYEVANTNNIFYFYNYIATIAKNNNVDYISFNFILCSITTLIILLVIFKYSKMPALTVSFMYLFPLIDNVIQKRWYYAMGIVIIALIILSKFTFKRVVAYFVLITIAMQLHEGAILFFSVPILYIVLKKISVKYFIYFSIILLFFSRYISKISSILLPEILKQKENLYFQKLASTSTFSHYAFWIFWQLSFILLFYILLIKNRKNVDSFTKYVWFLNIWSIIIIPFYSYDPVFSRMFRPIIILNYILISNRFIVKNYKIEKINLFANVIQIFICMVSFIAFDVTSNLGFDYVVLELFKNNLFLM